MEHQETKFSFVYNEVKQRILNGQVLPGNSLPSSRMLCDQYHVSRYTVNRVFDALKKDGLIEIQPRLARVVLDGGENARVGAYTAGYFEKKRRACTDIPDMDLDPSAASGVCNAKLQPGNDAPL
ncbi:MAG: winged helix-turn-helix domain-containing protein [Ruthenibacterium lactatiformans]